MSKITLKKGYIDLALDPRKKQKLPPKQEGWHVLKDSKDIGLFIHKFRGSIDIFVITQSVSGLGTTISGYKKEHLVKAITLYLSGINWLKTFDTSSVFYRENIRSAITAAKDCVYDQEELSSLN